MLTLLFHDLCLTSMILIFSFLAFWIHGIGMKLSSMKDRKQFSENLPNPKNENFPWYSVFASEVLCIFFNIQGVPLKLQFIPLNAIIYWCICNIKHFGMPNIVRIGSNVQFLKVWLPQNAKNLIYWDFANICKFGKHIASKTTLGVKMHLYYDIWMRMSKYDTLEALWPQNSLEIWS